MFAVNKRRVLILGGGLSALSAGIHLLERDGREAFDVTLVTMEHRLGGKASSYRLPDGRYMETGFHGVFGYYASLQKLLARAGHAIDDTRYFTPNDGDHLMYEASARHVNRLHIPQGPLDVSGFLHNGFASYQGMSVAEKLAAGKWFATIGARLLLEKIDSAIDEHSFTAYAIATGLELGLTQKSWFRYVLDLAFNYPAPGSAYVGMIGFQRLIGPQNSTVYYLNGPLSEVIVAPVARLYHSLGGKIEFCRKAVRVTLSPASHRIEQVVTQPTATPLPIAGVVDHVGVKPIGGSYSLADDPYPTGDPAAASGAPERVLSLGSDFDDVIWTLPVESTRALLRTTPDFERAVIAEPQLRRIWALRTVASISLRMWLREKVMPPDYATVVMGTPQPAATIIDYTNRVTELAHGSYGSVIEFEGEEGLHGALTDTEIVRELLENFSKLPFVDRRKLDVDAIVSQTGGNHFLFRRNTADHLRYLLMEPGHWKFRPDQSRSPYENLVFAGDWMLGTQPTASMEAAVRTGRVAADRLRERAGLSPSDA